MITIFHDKLQTNAHRLFQDWRAANPSGYFINCKGPKNSLLHDASCSHLGDTGWGSEDYHTLTDKRKVCARITSELRAWAAEHHLRIGECKHCKRRGLNDKAPGILSRAKYAASLQTILSSAPVVAAEEGLPQFASAIELLAPGETALVIFTEGHHLTDNHDGTGSTAWWKINPQRKVDRVIIYRGASDEQTDNDLFVAKYSGVEGPRKDGRYSVRLLDLKLAGHPASNWPKFAATNQNPIRYMSKTNVRMHVCFCDPEHLSTLKSLAGSTDVAEWTINRHARTNDLAIFYVKQPHAEFVAWGVVQSDASNRARPNHPWSGHYIAHIDSITMLPRPVSRAELREKLSEWGYLKAPHQSIAVPVDIQGRLERLLGIKASPPEKNSPVVTDPARSQLAVDDLGSPPIGNATPDRAAFTHWTYLRDRKVREHFLRRANGRCEYCGKMGFLLPNGRRFVETHHIIALAKDSADTPQNVIALCPNHHREAHYGKAGGRLETEMIKVLPSPSK